MKMILSFVIVLISYSASAQILESSPSDYIDIDKVVTCSSMEFNRAPYLNEDVPKGTSVYTRRETKTLTYRDLVEDAFIYYDLNTKSPSYAWRYGSYAKLIHDDENLTVYQGRSLFGDMNISLTTQEDEHTHVVYTLIEGNEFLFSFKCI